MTIAARGPPARPGHPPLPATAIGHDWGAHWTPGSLLPVGGDTLAAVSFAAAGSGRWAGWLIHSTASGNLRIEATADTGRTLTPVPGSPATDNVQVVGPAAGFAWGLESTDHPAATILSLYRTRDNGRHWLRSPLVLPQPASDPPLLDFTGTGNGWLVIGTWHTRDGGRTWHRA